MKLLLCCDEYIYSCNGKYYFKNQEWSDFFHRYLRVFEQVRLVTRCKVEESVSDKRILLDETEFDYCPLPFFQGPVQYAEVFFAINRILGTVISGCDCAILRLPFAIAEKLGRKVIKSKIPYALEIVYDAEDAWRGATDLITKILWKKIDLNMRYLAKNANGVSCVTEFYLQKHYFSNIKDSFKANYSSLSLPSSFYTSSRSYPEGRNLTVVNVANQVEFNGRKGHNEIICAIGELKKEGLIVNAKFVGEDYCDGISQLMALAKEIGVEKQIQFTGFLQRDQLSKCLDESDIYVMPTKAEGLPRVVIEAMAKGLPCITTDVSGNSELIGKRYLYSDFYDISSLKSLIKILITDKAEYEQASAENYNNSLKYEASILQSRRDAFYMELKEFTLRRKI